MKVKINLFGLDKKVENFIRKKNNILFEIGILKDIPRKNKSNKQKKFGKTSISGTNRALSKVSNSEILRNLDNKNKILSSPFVSKQTKQINDILVAIAKSQNPNQQSLINGVVALVKEPILNKRYGNNIIATIKKKGFNFKFVDTGQLIKNIQARIIKKG